MIKAVVFDFGQTLVNSAAGFKTAEKQAQTVILKDLQSRGKAISMTEFMDVYRPIRKRFHDRSIFSRQKIWHHVYGEHGFDPDHIDLEKWEGQYWETVETHTNLFPEVMDTFERLSEDYKLALITNTQGQTSSQEHRLRHFPGLTRLFEAVIVAGESGVPPKPDPVPFGLCLNKLGLPPNEAVYVGDDWRIDMCGARDAGLHAVWLKHHSVKRNWPKVESGIPVITALNQLPDLLASFFSDEALSPHNIPLTVLPDNYRGKIMIASIIAEGRDACSYLRSGDVWHREILKNFEKEVEDHGLEHIHVIPKGGAFVEFEDDGGIVLSGSSDEFGMCDMQEAADLIQKVYPGRKVRY